MRIPKHLSPQRTTALRERLKHVEMRFHRDNQIENDPISLVLRYQDPQDREVAAFLAAVFAYGNVKQIQKTLHQVFGLLGPHPVLTLRESTGTDWFKKIPPHFKHRFNTAKDLGLLLTWLGGALRESGTLREFFYKSLSLGSIDFILEDFIDRLTALPPAPFSVPKSKGALFFLPRPSSKSACKRLLLFLRWVGGSGPMDLNLWSDFPREKLLIPVDTHVLRISRHLGLTKRKDNSWKTAMEITESLKLLDPADPTRFDFALCHLGISQACPSHYDKVICKTCEMNSLCLTYARKSKIR